MKTILKTLILLIVIGTSFQSCSSDDNDSKNLDQRFSKKWYIGTQYIDIGQGVSCENNYYDLKSNGDIEYRNWYGDNNCDAEIYNGEWYTENDVLYRKFPSDPGTNNEVLLSDEVVSVSDTELVLKRSNGDDITYYNYN